MSLSKIIAHIECDECGADGDDFASPNVEAWEVTGELVCDDCAEAVLERHAEAEDQSGEAA